jgi:hypothetical protein
MENPALLQAGVAAGPAGPTPDWQAFLPAEWRDMVIAPLDFKQHLEYEMAATRSFGYDVDGAACYYAHSYLLNESRSDDDEDFYEVVAYGESVHAWRLRDERWLTYRVVYAGGEGSPGRGFYSLSEQAPR